MLAKKRLRYGCSVKPLELKGRSRRGWLAAKSLATIEIGTRMVFAITSGAFHRGWETSGKVWSRRWRRSLPEEDTGSRRPRLLCLFRGGWGEARAGTGCFRVHFVSFLLAWRRCPQTLATSPPPFDRPGPLWLPQSQCRLRMRKTRFSLFLSIEHFSSLGWTLGCF